MLDDDQLEAAVRELIIDLCEIMYQRGYESVPVGAMMRLVGVGNERAAKHDHEFLALDEDFQKTIKTRKTRTPEKTPPGVTLH